VTLVFKNSAQGIFLVRVRVILLDKVSYFSDKEHLAGIFSYWNVNNCSRKLLVYLFCTEKKTLLNSSKQKMDWLYLM